MMHFNFRKKNFSVLQNKMFCQMLDTRSMQRLIWVCCWIIDLLAFSLFTVWEKAC